MKEFKYTPILIVLPVATAVFYGFCRNNYYPSMKAVSLWTASEVPKSKPPSEAIIQAYTPPVMQDGHPGIREKRSNLATQLDSSLTGVL